MRSLNRLRDEHGSNLLEVAVAAGLVGVAVIGLTGAMTFGMVAVGSARQRSTAVAAASERIEQVRNLPYSEIALDVEPAHDPDADHPNHRVTTDSPSLYDVHGDGSLVEPFAVGGSLTHEEGPITAGTTVLHVYQYVTWVDDPNIDGTENYKRITVVASLDAPAQSGSSSQVSLSTFTGEGTVTVPGATPAPIGSPDPTPTPSAGPTPTPNPECDSAPTGTMEIISGAGAETGYTSSTTLQVQLSASSPDPDDCDPLDAQLSNDASTFSSVASLVSGIGDTVTWTIPAGDGTATVHTVFVDNNGNASPIYQASIILDQTPPTVPGNLREVSCSISSNTRSVTMTWDASSDTNLSGYRMYESINDSPFSIVNTTGDTSSTQGSNKTEQSVRYLVRSYDKAGNESPDSEILSYAKNSC